MKRRRYQCLVVAAIFSLTGTLSVPARSDGEESISPERPLSVTADYFRYNESTGDMQARGHVDMTHVFDRYRADYAYGNLAKREYFIPGELTWTNAALDVQTQNLTVDGVHETATFDRVSGWESGLYYFRGTKGMYDRAANRLTVGEAMLTTKHAMANVPDYRIEADSIDVYPRDYYVAKNVRLKFKNTTVLTMNQYSASLRDSRGSGLWSLMPRPVFNSDNGFGLKSSLFYMLSAENGIRAYWDNEWYSRVGYKPDIGIEWNNRIGRVSVGYANEESAYNEEHYWIKKSPFLSFRSKPIYLGRSPFYGGVHGEIGRWDEDGAKGSYRGYGVYLSSDPIHLGSHLTFDWRVGYRRDYYGYKGERKGMFFDGNESRSNVYYAAGISGEYGIWTPFVRYTDNHISGETPYYFDDYDMQKPLSFGTKVRLTRLDSIGVRFDVDTVNGHLEHREWTYYRDMHSFLGWITYDDRDNSWDVMIEAKDFHF